MITNVMSLIVPVAGLFGFSTSGLLHFAIDATLVSVCLSGIKRSTGLSPAITKIQNKELKQFLITYLELGEWILDFVIVFMGRSSAFERR